MANSSEKITRKILGTSVAARGSLWVILFLLVFVAFYVDQKQSPHRSPTPQRAHEHYGSLFYLVTALIPLIPGIVAAFMMQPQTRTRGHALATLDLEVLLAGAVAVAILAIFFDQKPLVSRYGLWLVRFDELGRCAACRSQLCPSKSTCVITLFMFLKIKYER